MNLEELAADYADKLYDQHPEKEKVNTLKSFVVETTKQVVLRTLKDLVSGAFKIPGYALVTDRPRVSNGLYDDLSSAVSESCDEHAVDDEDSIGPPIQITEPPKSIRPTVSLNDIKLIFNERDRKEIGEWSLPKEPAIGTVGCFTADRCPSWNPFVVVGFDEETHTITAAYPRMKVNDDGTVQLGQDCLTFKNPKIDVTCRCGAVQQGGDGFCACGAAEERQKQYHDTFVMAPAHQLYETTQFVHYEFKKFDYTYHEFVRKEELNSIQVHHSE